MPRSTALSITLSQSQKRVLEQIVRCHSSEQRLVRRAHIVLKANEGLSNAQIARDLGINRETAQLWRQRWDDAAQTLSQLEIENVSDKQLHTHIQDLLADLPRPGAPATFEAQQVVRIVALACEEPQASGIPVSEWTPQELADEAQRRGIVESISTRSVERFLKRSQSATASDPLLAQC